MTVDEARKQLRRAIENYANADSLDSDMGYGSALASAIDALVEAACSRRKVEPVATIEQIAGAAYTIPVGPTIPVSTVEPRLPKQVEAVDIQAGGPGLTPQQAADRYGLAAPPAPARCPACGLLDGRHRYISVGSEHETHMEPCPLSLAVATPPAPEPAGEVTDRLEEALLDVANTALMDALLEAARADQRAAVEAALAAERNRLQVEWSKVEVEYRERIAGLEVELRRANGRAACDACGGDGKPVSGLPCMCKGTGLAAEGLITLREELFDKTQRIAALEAELAEARVAARDLAYIRKHWAFDHVEWRDGCAHCALLLQILTGVVHAP